MEAKFLYPPKPNSSGISLFDPGFQRLSKLNKNFVMELKIDGWAALVIIDNNGNYHYYNRHGEKLNTTFFSKSKTEFEKQKFPKNSIFGFEAVGNRSISVKDMMIFYGVYMYDGKLTNMMSYEENKKLLKKSIKQVKNHILVLDHYTLKKCKGDFVNKFKELCEKNEEYKEIIEGVILKDLTKPIKSSFIKTSKLPYWIKFRINNGRRK